MVERACRLTVGNGRQTIYRLVGVPTVGGLLANLKARRDFPSCTTFTKDGNPFDPSELLPESKSPSLPEFKIVFGDLTFVFDVGETKVHWISKWDTSVGDVKEYFSTNYQAIPDSISLHFRSRPVQSGLLMDLICPGLCYPTDPVFSASFDVVQPFSRKIGFQTGSFTYRPRSPDATVAQLISKLARKRELNPDQICVDNFPLTCPVKYVPCEGSSITIRFTIALPDGSERKECYPMSMTLKRIAARWRPEIALGNDRMGLFLPPYCLVKYQQTAFDLAQGQQDRLLIGIYRAFTLTYKELTKVYNVHRFETVGQFRKRMRFSVFPEMPGSCQLFWKNKFLKNAKRMVDIPTPELTVKDMPPPSVPLVEFDPEHPDHSLRVLAAQFEVEPQIAEMIPKPFIEYFGIGALANSLKLVFPELPPFNEQADMDLLAGQTFPTLGSLIAALSALPTDMDKLFGIYYWTCVNVSYDINERDSTVESVFNRRKAKCDGYSLFYEGMATRLGITQFEFRPYSSMAKGSKWNTLHPPEIPRCTHAAVVVVIDGENWLSEPTWGAGAEGSDGEFHFRYNRARFLQPMICSMNDHFPIYWSADELFGWSFPYEQFAKIGVYNPNEHEYRNESHPFARLTAPDGSIKIQFSCNETVTRLSTTMECSTPQGWAKQAGALSGVEVVRIVCGRQKCFLHAAFPGAGLYRIVLFLNGHDQDTMYIDSATRNTQIRPTDKAGNDHGFIPLIPQSACVTAPNGQLRIAFAAFSRYATFQADVMTPADKPLKGSFRIDRSQTAIPCDGSRTLTDFRITFTANNECTVRIWIGVGGNRLVQFVDYRVTVSGVTSRAAPPSPQMNPIDMNVVNRVVERALNQDEFDDLRDFYERHPGRVARSLPPRSVPMRRGTPP
jgi:hypothetical protein